MKIGIVGLPNVGKSTLFNALTQAAVAQGYGARGKLAKAQNVPFTTIEPNVGVVPVPDGRLEKLAAISKSEKITPTTIEFVDIAGLVRDAHKGEGLGNQFLANIREVDAIVHVVRFFDEAGITHVEGGVDPQRDVETINLELALADLATAERVLERVRDKAKGQDREALAQLPMLERIVEHLAGGGQVRELMAGDDNETPLNPPLARGEAVREVLQELHLLTAKPVLYVANVSERDVANPPQSPLTKGGAVIPLSVKIEQELVELSDEERVAFLQEYGLAATGLDRLIQAAYELLGLITFLTTGPTETRAWTVRRGARAPEAAGQIHSDMERGFIRAETVAYDDLVAAGTQLRQGSAGQAYAAARAAGKVRDEGKEYVVQDGDVMLFKFSV